MRRGRGWGRGGPQVLECRFILLLLLLLVVVAVVLFLFIVVVVYLSNSIHAGRVLDDLHGLYSHIHTLGGETLLSIDCILAHFSSLYSLLSNLLAGGPSGR